MGANITNKDFSFYNEAVSYIKDRYVAANTSTTNYTNTTTTIDYNTKYTYTGTAYINYNLYNNVQEYNSKTPRWADYYTITNNKVSIDNISDIIDNTDYPYNKYFITGKEPEYYLENSIQDIDLMLSALSSLLITNSVIITNYGSISFDWSGSIRFYDYIFDFSSSQYHNRYIYDEVYNEFINDVKKMAADNKRCQEKKKYLENKRKEELNECPQYRFCY